MDLKKEESYWAGKDEDVCNFHYNWILGKRRSRWNPYKLPEELVSPGCNTITEIKTE